MVATRREMEALLRENGFQYVRESHSGSLWRDGKITVVVPSKTKSEGRSAANALADIKRAIRLRDAGRLVVPPKIDPDDEPEPAPEPKEEPVPVDQKRSYQAAPPPQPAPPPQSTAPQPLPDCIVGILTDPTLTDRQKIRMITAYTELD